MRLAASGLADRIRRHYRRARQGMIEIGVAAEIVAGGIIDPSSRGRRMDQVQVARQLGKRQRMVLLAPVLTQRQATAHVGWRASLQIGEAESGPPVAAIGRTQPREQRLILSDRQQLSVALGPSLWRKSKGHDLDFR